VDRADIFDRANRAALMGLVDTWTGGQVLIAATRDEDWQPPAGEGIAVYRLSQAERDLTTVERCGAVAA
jgi:hypothetical protein